jgi:hypothetical protein
MNKSEMPRIENKDWQKSKDLFLRSIDKNKLIPESYKSELKQIIINQFHVMHKSVYFAETIAIIS